MLTTNKQVLWSKCGQDWNEQFLFQNYNVICLFLIKVSSMPVNSKLTGDMLSNLDLKAHISCVLLNPRETIRMMSSIISKYPSISKRDSCPYLWRVLSSHSELKYQISKIKCPHASCTMPTKYDKYITSWKDDLFCSIFLKRISKCLNLIILKVSFISFACVTFHHYNT